MKKEFSYCVQCKDLLSGKIGDFVFSDDKPFEAISPIYDSLIYLYPWIEKNGFKHEYYKDSKYTPFRLIKK